MRPATDEEIAELEAGLDGLPEGPWAYRPNELDDWGVVRTRFNAVVANSRAGSFDNETPEARDRCRAAGLDPYEAVGRHIARCSPDLIRSLLARLKAAEG